MGAMSRQKKHKADKTTDKQDRGKRRSATARPQGKTPPTEAPAVSLFMPSSHAAKRVNPARTKPLSASALEKLLKKDASYAVKLIELQESPLIYEADLASLLQRQEVRQLALTQTKEGWEIQVLPLWKGSFLTLVSLKKEKRHYLDLDRLIRTITKHGPLPPTILIGE